ncbi:MAG: glycosyltransferase family 4 protein, partial [Methylacidiphilales bacterium]|nr:glycosyltransferase family 4 protein [Candidatus Methylacidiphilales bacterium]
SWMQFQKIPDEVNLVQGPMGSCEALFSLAEKTGRKIIKVFDSPNSHPRTLRKIWQKECDEFGGGYRIPIPNSFFEKVEREIASADLILCPSLFVKQSMIENGVSAERCIVSHFGVDTKIFKPRQTLPRQPQFICVGSICLRKGHHYLFRAWELIKNKLPDHPRLICIGNVRPDFRFEWKKWRGTFEHYPSLDHPDIAKLLASSTAFVLPSLEEGFARVITEAMASGLPIIATHQSGATTVVEHFSEGIIVPAYNVEELAQAMLLLANDKNLNLQMGEKSFQKGGQKNSWHDYAMRLLDYYVDFSERIHRENQTSAT